MICEECGNDETAEGLLVCLECAEWLTENLSVVPLLPAAHPTKEPLMRNIQITITATVSDDATDADIALLVSQAVAQVEDPRDEDGEYVSFTTERVVSDWFTVKD